MQTAQRNRKTDRNGGEQRHHTFARPQAKDIATKGNSSQFLMQTLRPKKNQALECCKDFQELGLDKERALNYLNDCVTTFAKVRNIAYNPINGGGFTKNLKYMFDFVKRNIPASRILNIDYNSHDKLLMFFESERLEFPNSEVFFMPIACLDYFEGTMRELLVRLFCNLSYTQGFETPQDHWDFMCCLDMMDERDLDDDEYDEGYKTAYNDYREGGHTYSLFKEIEAYRGNNDDFCNLKKSLQLVNKASEELDANDKFSTQLLQTIENGLVLMDECCLHTFDYHPEISLSYGFDNEYYGEQMLIARLCCLTCGTEDNDPIVESAMNILNADAGNYADFVMYDVHPLLPTDTEVWEPSDYPHRFAEWYCEIYNLIDDYEPRFKSEQDDRNVMR